MVGHFLGPVVGHIADGDIAVGGGFHVHGIKAHAVSDDGLAALEFSNASTSDGDVVPNNQDGGFEDFLVEIGITITKVSVHMRCVTNNGALYGSGGLTRRLFGPVNDGNAWRIVCLRL